MNGTTKLRQKSHAIDILLVCHENKLTQDFSLPLYGGFSFTVSAVECDYAVCGSDRQVERYERRRLKISSLPRD